MIVLVMDHHKDSTSASFQATIRGGGSKQSKQRLGGLLVKLVPPKHPVLALSSKACLTCSSRHPRDQMTRDSR